MKTNIDKESDRDSHHLLDSTINTDNDSLSPSTTSINLGELGMSLTHSLSIGLASRLPLSFFMGNDFVSPLFYPMCYGLISYRPEGLISHRPVDSVSPRVLRVCIVEGRHGLYRLLCLRDRVRYWMDTAVDCVSTMQFFG